MAETTVIKDPSSSILDNLLDAGKDLAGDFIDLLKFEKQIELNNTSQTTQEQLNSGSSKFREGDGDPALSAGGTFSVNNTALIIGTVAAGALVLILALR